MCKKEDAENEGIVAVWLSGSLPEVRLNKNRAADPGQ